MNNKAVLNVVTREESFLTHETEWRSVQVVILKHICPVFGDNAIFIFSAWPWTYSSRNFEALKMELTGYPKT